MSRNISLPYECRKRHENTYHILCCPFLVLLMAILAGWVRFRAPTVRATPLRGRPPPPACSLFSLFSLSTGLGASVVVGWRRLHWGLFWGPEGLVVVFAFFFPPPPHRFSPIGFGFFGGGQEEAAGHLVKGGVAWVFHLDNTTLVAMDPTNGAELQPPVAGDVGDGPDHWVLGTVAHLWGWGGGFGRGGGGLGGLCALTGWGGFCLGYGVVGALLFVATPWNGAVT